MSNFSTALAVVLALSIIFAARIVTRKQDGVLLRSVAILVLGDIGRSPRMMYHAESFAEAGFRTHLIGYAGLHFIL